MKKEGLELGESLKISPSVDQVNDLITEYYKNWQTPPRYYEENDGISITQPVEMTLREMVERYVRDGEMPIRNDGIYDEEEEHIMPQNFDLSDLTEAQTVIDKESIEIGEQIQQPTEQQPSERATPTNATTEGGGTTTEGGESVGVPTTAPAV